MIKKILKGMAIGSAALMLTAGAASAETVNVNIYGASAQFTFWTNAAADFLQSPAIGCASTDVYTLEDEIQGRDVGAAVCAGNTPVVLKNGETLSGTGATVIDNNTIIIRYTSKASYDGIRAVSEAENWDQDGCQAAGGEWGERLQANLANATRSGSTLSVEDVADSLSCQDVHIGASDVAAETFAQTSSGAEEGPLGGDPVSRSVVYPNDLPATANLIDIRPVVVPFGFFANNGATDGSYPAVPVNNLTRLQAVSILSGAVANWSEIDGTTDLRVAVCHRHAGSGTVATLNAAVLRGDANLPTEERTKGLVDTLMSYGMPEQSEIYFNDGSSDLMRCVGQTAGAIGYADFDKCLPGELADVKDDQGNVTGQDDHCRVKEYGEIKRVTLNGAETVDTNPAIATTQKENVQNGVDAFWSAQWLYYHEKEVAPTSTVISALGDFASLESNLPSKKAPYWSSQAAMKYEKTSDFSLPTKK